MTGLFEESDHCGQPSLKQYLTPARCSAPDQSRPACGQRLPSSNARFAKNECGTMDYAKLLCFLCVSAFHETHDSPALQKHVSSARCSTPAHIGMCMCNMRGYHSECSAVVQAHSRRAIAARTIAARTLRARGSTPCLHQATCKSVHTPPNASTVLFAQAAALPACTPYPRTCCNSTRRSACTVTRLLEQCTCNASDRE